VGRQDPACTERYIRAVAIGNKAFSRSAVHVTFEQCKTESRGFGTFTFWSRLSASTNPVEIGVYQRRAFPRRGSMVKFARDRNAYRVKAREHLRQYEVSVLDNCMTSNHVHLSIGSAAVFLVLAEMMPLKK
jgi:hypothetical protein